MTTASAEINLIQSATIKPSSRVRLESIDLLRGLIMVLMGLDHVRDYFTGDTLSPENLAVTTPLLFLTRWISHFCAPVFVLLAGTSAYLYADRGRTKGELSHFLWTRGLWLVVLELTLVNWAWHFNLSYSRIMLQVIWALGMSMIGLAGLVYLPTRWVIGIGAAMIAGHNLLDGITFPGSDWRFLPWTILHDVPKGIGLGEDRVLFFLYPVIPWVGLMAAGYGLGQLFLAPSAVRRRWLWRMGWGMVGGFVLLRLTNVYGDAARWSVQSSPVLTVLSFLNCTKYPPSLLYLLMTVGPALLVLAAVDGKPLERVQWLVVFGRVPLFFYLLHLYLIHGLAGVAALVFGRTGDAGWILTNHFNVNRPEGYGYPLWAVYGTWLLVIALLYSPCRWYANFKRRNHNPWLSYL